MPRKLVARTGIASAVAMDAAKRNMEKQGRSELSREDFGIAFSTFNRLIRRMPGLKMEKD
jgi:hypothetical protein